MVRAWVSGVSSASQRAAPCSSVLYHAKCASGGHQQEAPPLLFASRSALAREWPLTDEPDPGSSTELRPKRPFPATR